MLAQYDELDSFVEGQRSTPACDQLLALSERTSDILRSNLSTWPKEGSLEETHLAGRGFNIEHAGFIYRQLSSQRRVLTAARVLHPERFHGWSILIYMMLVLIRTTGHLNCPGS